MLGCSLMVSTNGISHGLVPQTLTTDFTTSPKGLEVKKPSASRGIKVKDSLLCIQDSLCATLGWGYSCVCTPHGVLELTPVQKLPSFYKLKTSRR